MFLASLLPCYPSLLLCFLLYFSASLLTSRVFLFFHKSLATPLTFLLLDPVAHNRVSVLSCLRLFTPLHTSRGAGPTATASTRSAFHHHRSGLCLRHCLPSSILKVLSTPPPEHNPEPHLAPRQLSMPKVYPPFHSPKTACLITSASECLYLLCPDLPRGTRVDMVQGTGRRWRLGRGCKVKAGSQELIPMGNDPRLLRRFPLGSQTGNSDEQVACTLG